jgi:hypothetical protein
MSIAIGIIVASGMSIIGFTSFQASMAVRVTLVATALLWLGFSILRCARAGARPDNSALIILNPLRTIKVPWYEVRRFTLDRHWLSQLTAHVELRDGARIHNWGIAAPNPFVMPNSRSAQRLVEELNDLLETKQAADVD